MRMALGLAAALCAQVSAGAAAAGPDALDSAYVVGSELAAGSKPAPSLDGTFAFIRATGARRADLDAWARRSPDPATAGRQEAFLRYLETLDPLPAAEYRPIASGGRFLPEMYDPAENRVVVDEELAAVPVEERAPFVVHCLRHYFAIARPAPGTENKELHALEAQAIFWAVARTWWTDKPCGRRSLLKEHLDSLLQAYLAGGLAEFQDSIRRGA